MLWITQRHDWTTSNSRYKQGPLEQSANLMTHAGRDLSKQGLSSRIKIKELCYLIVVITAAIKCNPLGAHRYEDLDRRCNMTHGANLKHCSDRGNGTTSNPILANPLMSEWFHKAVRNNTRSYQNVTKCSLTSLGSSY